MKITDIAEHGSRRATDRVASEKAFELISTLAMEYAFANDEINKDAVQLAIDKCREKLRD